MTVILKLIFLAIAVAAFNMRPIDNPPRYWNTLDIDSLAEVAAHKTDSSLGVYVYLEEMEKLKALE